MEVYVFEELKYKIFLFIYFLPFIILHSIGINNEIQKVIESQNYLTYPSPTCIYMRLSHMPFFISRFLLLIL